MALTGCADFEDSSRRTTKIGNSFPTTLNSSSGGLLSMYQRTGNRKALICLLLAARICLLGVLTAVPCGVKAQVYEKLFGFADARLDDPANDLNKGAAPRGP